MNFNLDKAIETLARTPQVYRALLSNSQYQIERINEGPGTWSGYNIIGHLIHGEKTDWIPRAEIILGDRQNKTFEPYDRFAQDKLYASQSTEELLSEFESLRKQNLDTLRSWSLTEQDLRKEGIHPDFGVVTLKQLLSTWTVHDLSHINQLSRAIVKHYAADVGPWKKYISLLKD